MPPPIFVFAPSPPIFFLPPTVFFLGEEEVGVFGRKKRSNLAILAGKSLRISAKIFLFGDHLLLVGKFVISARKSLRISAKTFAPLILILPPPDLAKLATPLARWISYNASCINDKRGGECSSRSWVPTHLTCDLCLARRTAKTHALKYWRSDFFCLSRILAILGPSGKR